MCTGLFRGSLRGGRPTDAPESRPSQEGTRAHRPRAAQLRLLFNWVKRSSARGSAPVQAREGSSSFTHLSLEGPRDARHAEDVTHSAQGWRPQPGKGAPVSAQTGRAPSAHSAGRRRGSREKQAAGPRKKGRHSPHPRAFRLVPDNCQQPGGGGGEAEEGCGGGGGAEKAAGALQTKNNSPPPGRGNAAAHKRTATVGADQRAPGTSGAAPTLTKAPLCL